MFPIIAAVLAGIVVFSVVIVVMLSRGKARTSCEESVPQINRRKEARMPLTSEFDLFWQDADASRKSARARGIEVSLHGASVRSPRPILCNSVIQIRGREVQFEGRATVRRCTRKGMSYIIGLELEDRQFQNMGLRA
jgi:hypothetical protein